MSEELVLIARVRKAHGLKGEVEIEPFVWDETRFEKLRRIYVRARDGSISEQTVQAVHYVHKGIHLTLKDFPDRTAAERLRGAEILIPVSERPKLPEGRAYYDEVIGLNVVDDETGEVLGRVRNILDLPASDVYVLDLNGKEHLLTNAGEEIRSLDLKKKELRVKLLEPYSASE